MAIQAQIENLQSMKVGINGPDGANTLIITTGLAVINIQSRLGGQRSSFSALLDPVLLQGQFRRAIATGAPASVQYAQQDPAQLAQLSWALESIEVDMDDETGKVELQCDISVNSGGANNYAAVYKVAFQVTTLAAL